MDHDEELPSSLAALYERLRRGETLTIEDVADGLVYQLYLDAQSRVMVKQGEQEHHFHHLEAAVVGLLSLLGEFSESKQET